MGQLPQEIIDAIIDQFATSDEAKLRIGNEPREADALKACALTARAFRSKSQRHLFASILCSTSHSDKLEVLVSGSPHLIASYVTYFIIVLRTDKSTRVVDFTVVSRILALLENLVYLQVCSSVDRRGARMWPAIFKNTFHEALLLPAFRSLSLVSCTFADVLELESLIGHASGLKALTLKDVEFDNTDARRADPVSHKPRIVLDSLEVTSSRIPDAPVDAMLSSFTTLDITHLRALAVSMRAPLIPLLKANGRTVQKVRYYFPQPEDSDPHILENNTSLRHIDITQTNAGMARSLRVFGDLGRLMALRTVSLRFHIYGGNLADVTQEPRGSLRATNNTADMGQLPQEIIDAIIDQFATPDEAELRLGNEPREAEALKACALTARAFRSRSQRHLFASIFCFTSDSDKLETLVSGSPHLIASYVMYFIIVLHADMSTRVVDFQSYMVN
ncbi:hypothetical protein C8J57DRAFT_1732119 [Mycena rebaudengoi]|nr:hypothetical protein C8J57DRAFT_1732119 [Mycena rebaudengoi]